MSMISSLTCSFDSTATTLGLGDTSRSKVGDVPLMLIESVLVPLARLDALEDRVIVVRLKVLVDADGVRLNEKSNDSVRASRLISPGGDRA